MIDFNVIRYNCALYQESEHKSAKNGREEASPVISNGEINGSHFNAEQDACPRRHYVLNEWETLSD